MCLAENLKNRAKGNGMVVWSIVFLIVAIIAAILGFSGISEAAAGIAQIIFFIFLALLVASLLARATWGKPPPK